MKSPRDSNVGWRFLDVVGGEAPPRLLSFTSNIKSGTAIKSDQWVDYFSLSYLELTLRGFGHFTRDPDVAALSVTFLCSPRVTGNLKGLLICVGIT